MKLLHISDLHLGKRVNGFSMMEDQKDILAKILRIIDEQQTKIVMIAGDIYDKSVPSAEAVEVFDEFLVCLAARNCKVLMISGNHDSPERMAFGGRLFDKSGIYVSPVFQGTIEPIVMEDCYGEVAFYLFPFVKPTHVRSFYPEEQIETYTQACKVVLDHIDLDPNKRNVLLFHQFVAGSSRTESEEVVVGGTEQVETGILQAFDYVALGHIHRAQTCGCETIRYCGTPLKYSFSEAKDQKSVTIVELLEKGTVQVSLVPLEAKRDMVELKGTYQELTSRSFYEGTTYPDDYVHVTLTDEEDIPEVLTKLRSIYHNIMKLDYDNRRTRSYARIDGAIEVEKKSPLAHFEELYEKQNGQPMNETQEAFMQQLLEQIWRQE